MPSGGCDCSNVMLSDEAAVSSVEVLNGSLSLNVALADKIGVDGARPTLRNIQTPFPLSSCLNISGDDCPATSTALTVCLLFVLVCVSRNLGTQFTAKNHLFIEIDTLDSSPFELSSAFKKY
jgi:hypothetical protein